ncbi:MAG TPA: hypothetical protein VME69_00910, partial [Methylocella sp.]|nr:hypothetical protein [Methylocella sp.]
EGVPHAASDKDKVTTAMSEAKKRRMDRPPWFSFASLYPLMRETSLAKLTLFWLRNQGRAFAPAARREIFCCAAQNKRLSADA